MRIIKRLWGIHGPSGLSNGYYNPVEGILATVCMALLASCIVAVFLNV